MTTDTQIPYADIEANGTQIRFPFEFTIVENIDLLVIVNGVLMIEYSAYTIEDLTDEGGVIVFSEPPPSGIRVLILRRTTISQNVDYAEFNKFPAETHEWNLDKITFILQELLTGAFGGLDSDGNLVVLTFDLSVTAGVTTVTINNSGGTDATLQPWVSGEKAGVFHGEIGTAPLDGAATDKPDGYIWIELT